MRKLFVRSFAIAFVAFALFFGVEFFLEWHRAGSPGSAQLSWAGVGNVDARLVRSGPELREDVALVFGGVLGYRMPRVRPATMPLARGDLLVMITDGIDAAISPALAGGGAAQALASRILDTHGKGSDDALAVVIRYR